VAFRIVNREWEFSHKRYLRSFISMQCQYWRLSKRL
jgi:hypothetical protein